MALGNSESQLEQSTLKLESDQRFGPITRRYAEKARQNAKEHQARHVKSVVSSFEGDHTIQISSIIREPNGTGGGDLSRFFDSESNEPKIVLLMNGLVNPQDIVQVLPPLLVKFGMAGARLASYLRGQVTQVVDEMKSEDTISGYMNRTIRRIQSTLFPGKPCKVLIVFNASKEDLATSVAKGGKETALVVGGHGTLGSVSMTNGVVSNTEIPTPEAPLKAFLQHTCAAPDESKEEMGQRWAQQTFGWRRGTTPADFINNPLLPRV